MGENDDRVMGEPVVFWSEGASQEQRDAHFRAMRWAHVLDVEIDRLYAARQTALASHEEVLKKGVHEPSDSWPFFIMDAEAHFALVSARQLLRALTAFDGSDRLPEALDESELRLIRDALEHWDEPAGRSAVEAARLGVDPHAHRWSKSGPGILGQLIHDAALQQWARDVYAELLTWDPWDGFP